MAGFRLRSRFVPCTTAGITVGGEDVFGVFLIKLNNINDSFGYPVGVKINFPRVLECFFLGEGERTKSSESGVEGDVGKASW